MFHHLLFLFRFFNADAQGFLCSLLDFALRFDFGRFRPVSIKIEIEIQVACTTAEYSNLGSGRGAEAPITLE